MIDEMHAISEEILKVYYGVKIIMPKMTLEDTLAKIYHDTLEGLEKHLTKHVGSYVAKHFVEEEKNNYARFLKDSYLDAVIKVGLELERFLGESISDSAIEEVYDDLFSKFASQVEIWIKKNSLNGLTAIKMIGFGIQLADEKNPQLHIKCPWERQASENKHICKFCSNLLSSIVSASKMGINFTSSKSMLDTGRDCVFSFKGELAEDVRKELESMHKEEQLVSQISKAFNFGEPADTSKEELVIDEAKQAEKLTSEKKEEEIPSIFTCSRCGKTNLAVAELHLRKTKEEKKGETAFYVIEKVYARCESCENLDLIYPAKTRVWSNEITEMKGFNDLLNKELLSLFRKNKYCTKCDLQIPFEQAEHCPMCAKKISVIPKIHLEPLDKFVTPKDVNLNL